MAPTYILGVSAFYHDSAAALLVDGEVVAAAQEERFTRKKHDHAYPRAAVDYCLAEAGITRAELTHVVFYEKPLSTFDRLLSTYLAIAPRGLLSFVRAMPVWLKEKLWIPGVIAAQEEYDGEVLFTEHHESHAASAFYPSPFRDATIVTMDGVGEWSTTSIAHGRGHELRVLRELHFPHSLGLLYSAFTQYAGFRVNSGEYKLMGLAPYGEPRYADRIREHLIDLKPDGSFHLNLRYFGYLAARTMTNRRFHRLFEGPPRSPEGPLTQREMDLARSVQVVAEEVMEATVAHAVSLTGCRDLCLAGGVALNCVANGRLLRSGLIDRLWVQPAAGDAGGALGAALAIWHRHLDKPRPRATGREEDVEEGVEDDLQRGSYLGPQYSDAEILAALASKDAPHERLEARALADRVAALLEDGQVIGWFQGRMEYGPRALGGRSILADPRRPDVQRTVNLKIKFRESFRPFAPAVLRERVSEWFECDGASPYMLLVADVAAPRLLALSDEQRALTGLARLATVRSQIPAVTHVDNSARLQTVDGRHNPRFAALLRAFEARTGCPVLLNTSFNVRGEPIVCTPEDAYRCFMHTDMDYLVLGDFLLDKRAQPERHARRPQAAPAAFALD
ncbi:MAG: carbamoyltransferase [Myxococcales bacterium]|nr:carbamoyltransferase [Myxococcales bacterium]